MTRRELLQRVGQVGGTAAVYRAMSAMGLFAAPPPTTRALELTGGANNAKVIVLGAGLAGMCAAYELTKAGYDCTILEARARPGGRCHTIRRGCVETEIDGKSQTCAFEDGQYFNPGPARVPQYHLTLDYCRELNVAIEPFINVNDAAWFHARGKRVRMRDAAAAAARGDSSEIIAKATTQEALDKPISRKEATELIGMMRWFGGADTREMVMFQIVGGTDRLAKAFADRLGSDVTYGARVMEIRQSADAVTIHYTDRLGRPQRATADYCICTIPLPVLKSIPADLSREMSASIAAVQYFPAAKAGLQFKRRFWEEDDRIFGGITRTDQSITQLFYPSYGYLGARGVVVGCYNYGQQAHELGKLSPEQRIARVLSEGQKIHPQYQAEFECGFTCAWEKVPYSMGAWTGYDEDGARTHLARFREPDGRIYLAGEHVSTMTGWMAGALQSARDVSDKIHRRVHA
jgi:monoamine oxidase